MYDFLCRAAAGCALLFSWAITVELCIGALFVAGLDVPDAPTRVSTELALHRAATYTLVIAVIFGAGALLFGGMVGAWALAEHVAAQAAQAAQVAQAMH